MIMGCLDTLKILAFDNMHSSTFIANSIIEAYIDCIDNPQSEKLLKYILQNQPSMAVVINTVLKLLNAKTIDSIKALKKNLNLSYLSAVEEAYETLKSFNNFCTISYSRAVFDVLLKIKPKIVHVSISHPKKEGEEFAKDMLKCGIEVVLFEDNAYDIMVEKSDIIVGGADAVFERYFVNKIGTKTLALLAKYYSKPFFVIADKFKWLSVENSKYFKIIPKDKNEISNISCKVINYYFEKIPNELVTKFFKGDKIGE